MKQPKDINKEKKNLKISSDLYSTKIMRRRNPYKKIYKYNTN